MKTYRYTAEAWSRDDRKLGTVAFSFRLKHAPASAKETAWGYAALAVERKFGRSAEPAEVKAA